MNRKDLIKYISDRIEQMETENLPDVLCLVSECSVCPLSGTNLCMCYVGEK